MNTNKNDTYRWVLTALLGFCLSTTSIADDHEEDSTYVGEDVLILRPAIIDLDITAPDVGRQGRSRTYTATAGAATLFVELFDSYSGDLIGRAVDRRATRSTGGFAIRSNRVTNRADARREFGRWADQLIAFLDQHYVEPASED
jgi:hypothetical protein